MRTHLVGKTLLIAALLAVPLSAQAASLSFDPSGGSYGPGDTFITDVRIDPQGSCVNAANIVISYPPQSLRAIDVGRGDSIFSLWVDAPKIDPDTGTITFSGGIPGGYCGEIQGDPAKSNILADLVFTVEHTDAKTATLSFQPTSVVYLNDGQGTEAPLSSGSATYRIAASATLTDNAWLDVLKTDTTPPEPFTIQVESTPDLFGGAYYAAFSTVDKQSGIDHYEIYENGFWQSVTSPHELADQSMKNGVQIRAVDKAGNIRLGTYNASSTPPRAYAFDWIDLLALIAIVPILFLVRWWWWQRHARAETPTS